MSKKILYGIITKKNGTTATVTVDKKIGNKKYKKIIKRRKNYTVNNSIENIKIGEKVYIEESIPKSKLKKWKIIKNNK